MSQSDLIIDGGFTVLNDFKPGAAAGDDGDAKSDPIPRCPFASYASALSISLDTHRVSFLNDCSLVFTARTKDDSDGYSTGSTFFLPCLMKPRCALEALAQTIFRAHVDSLGECKDAEDGERKLLYDPERSGAEWWTLILDTPSGEAPQKGDEDDDDDEEDDEVGIHFDADYGTYFRITGSHSHLRLCISSMLTLAFSVQGLEEQLPNFMLHPRVATITYLSDSGVPTLILNKRSPPPSDHEKKSLNGSINKAWLSHPYFGKHVAFDGRFLHGAPGKYFQSVNKDSFSVSGPKSKRLKSDENGTKSNHGDKRITFLVNVSVKHRQFFTLLAFANTSYILCPFPDMAKSLPP
jgi:hypothetical protein